MSKFLVIAGVILEVMGDAGIYESNSRIQFLDEETITSQQVKIVALDERVVHLASDNNTLERVLVSRRFFPQTSPLMANFLIRLRLYKGLKVLIYAVQDIEAKQFADDIKTSLRDMFGMDPEDMPVSDPPDVAEGIVIGVGASVRSHDAGVRLASIFDALNFGDMNEKVDPGVGSLTKVGIPVTPQWTPPPNSPQDIVRIDIGTRPFTETMLKLWHAPYPEMIPSPENGPDQAK
jgi:hypothetical protein